MKSGGLAPGDFDKPLIGIHNTYTEGGPGHIHLNTLTQEVRAGIYQAGGVPIEFGGPGHCPNLLPEQHDVPQRDIIAIDVVGEKVEAVRRRFKPMSEAMYEELHLPQEFELLFNEMACTGCRNGVLSTLRDLELEGRMDMLKNVRIVAGQMDTPPAPCDKRTIFVGICTAKHRGNCDYVQGCPPNNVDIISAITGTTDHQFFAVDKK
jgi:hypothetical protein